jgi:ABC-2 type transport system ATP-binding protein
MGVDNVQIIGQGNREAFANRIKALPYVESFHAADGILQIGVDAGNRRLVEIVETANQSGFSIEDISVARPSLGDVFLKFTGRQLRDK